ncbi:transmembrane protein 182-like [Sylvia atricapilla]|uniref:transmembrane protein 182-like n=1 Tax=Sylvia atricapilla TaxID=48155 RepID=UPI00339A7898
MKVGTAALAARILRGTGVLLLLIAFGMDYLLLATDTCRVFEHGNSTLSTGGAETPTEVGKEMLTFHHKGFFWWCWFFGEGHPETIWTFWYTSQAHTKFCMHGYLFPMPIAVGPFPHPSYDTTAVYRGFWTAFILLAMAAGLVEGLLLVCGVPFSSPCSYKVGGGFLLLSGGFFLLLVFLFVMWKEFAANFQKYILLERSEECLDDVPVHVFYRWSFIFAAARVPLVLLSGLLFFLVGRDVMDSLQ